MHFNYISNKALSDIQNFVETLEILGAYCMLSCCNASRIIIETI